MWQMFYLDVVYVCNDFQVFCKCYRRMLQVFNLNIAKVDLVSANSPRVRVCGLGRASSLRRRVNRGVAQKTECGNPSERGARHRADADVWSWVSVQTYGR
jgi:hypothetical protein